MRPYMWTPQSLQAYRWMAALASTTLSLSAFLETRSLSRGTTATCENIRGLPAFGASAYVIVGALGRNGHLDGVARTLARKRSSREVRRAGPDAVIHCRMN